MLVQDNDDQGTVFNEALTSTSLLDIQLVEALVVQRKTLDVQLISTLVEASDILVATTTPAMENVVLRSPPTLPVLLRDRHLQSFDRLLNTVFGAASFKAYRVADCEQGYKLSAGLDPFELNRTEVGRAGEVSLWQIHPIHFRKYNRDRLQADIKYAAQAAWELSGYGANWASPWQYCG